MTDYEALEREHLGDPDKRTGIYAPKEGCQCRACLKGQTVESGFGPIPIEMTRMIVCIKCGNKRCPHANDHRNNCSGSNDPGQLGSAYE